MPSRNALEILKLFKHFDLFPWSLVGLSAASELFAPNRYSPFKCESLISEPSVVGASEGRSCT